LPRRFFESKTRSREPHRVSHERLILDSVARISAFPEETIHVGQQLTDDLGFDSLMLVDLAEDIGMLWPEIEGVPYDSLTSEMRVQDVVDFVLARLPADAGRDTPPADILDFAHQEPAQHGGDQHCTVVPISRFSHAYLDSHVIAGQRVLPFAVAMDYVAAAALDAIGEGATVAFSITGFRAVRPVVVPGTTWLQLMTYRAPHERIESKVSVTLSQDNTVCYRGKIHVSNRPLDSFTAVAPSAVPLSVREFYDRATFQGPVLQGIVSIEGVDESGITGTVNVSKPGDWISQSGKNTWTIDPLAIDCGFQLAA
jgi:hypothetical protein